MVKWEYLITNSSEVRHESSTYKLDDGLDQLGLIGWELVAVSNGHFYFKRPKEEE